MTSCQRCGAEFDIPAKFCPNCGYRIPQTTDGASAAEGIRIKDLSAMYAPPEEQEEPRQEEEAPAPRRKKSKTGGLSRIAALLILVAVLLAGSGYLLTPAFSPVPGIRDADGDGVVDTSDFWIGGDGGIRFVVEDFTVMNEAIVLNGQRSCVDPETCPSTSFRLFTKVGIHDASHLNDGDHTVNIPDDAPEVAFRVDAAVSGVRLTPLNTMHVIEAPFATREWTMPFARDGIEGRVRVLVSAVGCPCRSLHSESDAGASDWPATDVRPAPVITVSVGLTGNGMEWSISLVETPMGLAPWSVALRVQHPDGSPALDPTPLPTLTGSAGYVPLAQPARTLHPGDAILLAVTAFSSESTFQLLHEYAVLAEGTLPLPPPSTLEVAVGISGNGTSWVLTISSVSLGLSPSSVYLTVYAANSTVDLWRTPLSALSGSVAFLPLDSNATTLQAGDRVLLNVAAFPAGTTFEIADDRGILAQGTLP